MMQKWFLGGPGSQVPLAAAFGSFFGTRKPVNLVKLVNLVNPVNLVPAKWCHEVLAGASLPRAGGQDDVSLSKQIPQINTL